MRDFVLSFLLAASILLVTAEARKEKPMHTPFPNEVVDAVSCDVCRTMARKAYGDVKALYIASLKTRVPVTEDDVLSAIEDICNPFAESGHWIRKIVMDCHKGAAASPITLDELPAYMKCKHTCTTVMGTCEAVINHDSMDHFSARLVRFQDYTNGEVFAHKMCDASPFCTERREIPPKRHEDLCAMIKADIMEEIDSKEMEVERMMDQMERKEMRRQEVFSREEILSIQQGLLEGDRESIARVDPSIMDLSDEELATLQAMARGKQGNPQTKDFQGDAETNRIMSDENDL